MKRFAKCLVAAVAAIAAGDGAKATAPEAALSSPQELRLAQAAPPGQRPPPTPQQRVAMLREWLQASKAQMRSYQWIETTVITRDGKESSRKQNTCYYGVDGRLQKVPVAGGTEESPGGPPGILPLGRLRERIAEHEDEKVAKYLSDAEALVHAYIPPDPDRLQQTVGAGRLSVNMLEPGRRVGLDFKDYLKAGDVLGVEIEVPTNRLLGMHVSTYLDDPKDAINLDVEMGVLPDLTIYIARSKLAAPAKDVTVTVENSGYRRTGG